MTKEEFLHRARNTHGYKYEYIDINNRLTLKDKIMVKYNDVIYNQNVNKHLSGRCPEKETPKKTTMQFIEESKKIWGDRFDYKYSCYNGAHKKVKLFDNIRGVFIEQIASSHLRGYESKYLTNEEFIERSKLVSDFLLSYEECSYKNTTFKVKLRCVIHGKFEINPVLHLSSGLGCRECDEFTFNRNTINFLDNYNILYYRQHKFEYCRNIFQLPFDFYIPSKRTAIEFDGIQHFQPVTHFGGVESFERLKINDKIKEDYCEENYINLIRIRYDQIDDIYKILWDNLKVFLKK